MRITVVGAGNLGFAMCAFLCNEGHDVCLYNRSEETVLGLKQSEHIEFQGVISGRAFISSITTNLREAIEDTQLILITTPAFAHKELAIQLSKILTYDVPIMLNPGRTFGALEFQYEFEKHSMFTPFVAETQSTVYTCRKVSDIRVDILSLKQDVLIAATDMKHIDWFIDFLPKSISSQLKKAKSLVETSIGNVGMIMHCAPLLLNCGWTENEYINYKYYFEGITPTIALFLEKLDVERVAVSKALGSKVQSTYEWLQHTYNLKGATLYECIQNNEAYHHIYAPTTLKHRYIYEDIPYGLVPLEAVGLKLGLRMKNTGLLIDLANAMLDTDFRLFGRHLEDLPLSHQNKVLDKIIEEEKIYESI